jgi:hypothetical protein
MSYQELIFLSLFSLAPEPDVEPWPSYFWLIAERMTTPQRASDDPTTR